jgi:hypothetical protein
VALASGQTLYLHRHAERALARHNPTTGDPGDIPTKASQHRGLLPWTEREVTNPARYTAPAPALAVPGAVPQLLDHDAEPAARTMLALAQLTGHKAPRIVAPGEPLALTAGRWVSHNRPPEGGTVTHHTALDIDGNVTGTGGRAKTSKRPSAVPAEAIKTDKVRTLDRGRIRLWAWEDQHGTVQARTMSGHDVRISPRTAAALTRHFNAKRIIATI